jgi:hypothetical protein
MPALVMRSSSPSTERSSAQPRGNDCIRLWSRPASTQAAQAGHGSWSTCSRSCTAISVAVILIPPGPVSMSSAPRTWITGRAATRAVARAVMSARAAEPRVSHTEEQVSTPSHGGNTGSHPVETPNKLDTYMLNWSGKPCSGVQQGTKLMHRTGCSSGALDEMAAGAKTRWRRRQPGRARTAQNGLCGRASQSAGVRRFSVIERALAQAHGRGDWRALDRARRRHWGVAARLERGLRQHTQSDDCGGRGPDRFGEIGISYLDRVGCATRQNPSPT